MQEVFRNSLLYRVFSAVFAWFSRQWRESPVIRWFLTPGLGRAMTESSVFSRISGALRRKYCALFSVLQLDRITENSIFRIPFLWNLLPFALAPILPTAAVIVLAVAGIFSILLCFGTEPDRKAVYSPANKFIVLYVIVYIVAVFASVTISGSLYGGMVTVLFVLYSLALMNSVSTRRQINIVIWTIVLCGALVSAYGIYQYVFGANGAAAWIDDDMFSDISTRVYSTLQNPNVLAEYLLLVIPFGVAGVLAEKGVLPKIIFLGCTAAMCLCMVLTFSRGGWLGLIFAAAVFFIILDRRFILVGLAALVALYFLLPDTIINRFTSIGNMADTSTSYRFSIWMGSISMLRDYWFCGIGPGTEAFNMIYPSYSYNSAVAQHSHNLYLQITCDSGVCGILLFLLIIFHSFKNVCSALAKTEDRKTRLYLNASLSGIVGFLVQSMTDYSFYNYRVMLMFWAFIAFGAILARRDSLPEV